MKSIKALVLFAISLTSLYAFAISEEGVIAQAKKDIQDAIIKSAFNNPCNAGQSIGENKFQRILFGRAVAVIQGQGGGGSAEGTGDFSEVYDGAVVVPAAEAYSSVPNALDGKPIGQVLGFKLVVTHATGSKTTKMTGVLSIYQSKSNNVISVSNFTIKD